MMLQFFECCINLLLIAFWFLKRKNHQNRSLKWNWGKPEMENGFFWNAKSLALHQSLAHYMYINHTGVNLHRDSISSSSKRSETISLVLRVFGLKSPPEITIFWICVHIHVVIHVCTCVLWTCIIVVFRTIETWERQQHNTTQHNRIPYSTT